MRLFTTILALFLSSAVLYAQDPPPPPGEEKPKTEEEILQENLWAALEPLKTVMEQEIEKQDEVWKKAEEDLFALGAKAIPFLEPLIYTMDDKGYYIFPQKLKEFLGREDQEAAGMVERVMRRHRWVSETDRKKLGEILEELKDKDSKAEDLFSQFSELGWFGVDGLKKEYASTEDGALKTKILDILDIMARQGLRACIDLLLDLTLDKDTETKRKAIQSLVNLAENAAYSDPEDKTFEAVDRNFKEEGAYRMMVGFLRLDKDTDVRASAARFLRWMEVREAAMELVNALDDSKDRVQDEALTALVRILGVKDDGKTKFDVLIRTCKIAWKKSASSFPAQIKAEQPARIKKDEGK